MPELPAGTPPPLVDPDDPEEAVGCNELEADPSSEDVDASSVVVPGRVPPNTTAPRFPCPLSPDAHPIEKRTTATGA
jgi:hypothetical protein